MIEVTVFICALSVMSQCDERAARVMAMAEHADDGATCRDLGQQLADGLKIKALAGEGMLVKCSRSLEGKVK
jgi:hypothetical protein